MGVLTFALLATGVSARKFSKEHGISSRLAEDLTNAGITTVPPHCVRRHKRDAFFKSHQGAATFLWPLLLGLDLVLGVTSLWRFAKIFAGAGESSLRRTQGYYLAFVLCLTFFAIVLIPFIPRLGFMLLLVPASVLVTIPLLIIIKHCELQSGLSYWQRTPLDKVTFGALGLPSLPPRLRNRLERAREKVPGVRFVVDHIGEDPILSVERRRHGMTERVAIGFWATGTDLDTI